MPSTSCFLKKPLPWMSLLGLVLACIFLCYGYSSFLLTSILTLLSTLIFNFSNHKSTPKTAEELVHQTISTQDVTSNLVLDRVLEEEEEGGGREQMMEDESLLVLSESECHGRSSTSEDSDETEYWHYDQGNIFRDNSEDDGSISDEDSLIEIALPSGVYIDHYKQEEKKKVADDFDFTAESFYKQQISLVELLAELNDMNEEENLIEIDISIGSIKCTPRFEIQA